MSFSRSKSKRFNELATCAPPPTAYDPKSMDKSLTVSFVKDGRFKQPKDIAPGPGAFNTTPAISTPAKKLFGGSTKKKGTQLAPEWSSKVKELEEQIKNLSEGRATFICEQCNQLEDSVEVLTEDNQRMRSRISELEESEQLLNTKIGAITDKNHNAEALTEDNQQMRSRISELEESEQLLNTKIGAITDKSHKVETLSGENQRMRSRISELEECEQLLNTNIRAITDKYHAVENNLVSAEQEKDQLEIQFQSERSTLKHSISELETDGARYRNNNMELMSQLQCERAGKDDLMNQLENSTAEISQLSQAMQEKEEKIQTLQESLEQSHDDIIKLNGLGSDLEGEHESLKEQLAQRAAQIEESERLAQNLTQEIAQLNEKLLEATTARENLEEQVQQQKEEIDRQGVELEVKEKLNDEVKLLSDQISEVTSSFDNATVELENFKTNAETTGRENAVLQEKLERLTETHETTTQSLATAQQDTADLRSKLEEARMENTGLEESLRKLRAITDELQSNFDESLQKLEELEEERETLSAKLAKVSKQKGELDEKIKVLEEDVEEIADDHDDAAVRLKESERLRKEYCNKMGELAKENRELKVAVQKLQAEVEELADDYDTTTQKLTDNESVQTDLKSKLTASMDEVARVTDDLEQQRDMVRKLEMTVGEQESSIAAADAKTLELENKLSALEKILDNNKADMMEQSCKFQHRLTHLTSKHEAEVHRLQGELKSTQETKKTSVQKLAEAENVLVNLRQKFEQQVGEVESLSTKVVTLHSQLVQAQKDAEERTQMKTEYERQVRELTDKLSALECVLSKGRDDMMEQATKHQEKMQQATRAHVEEIEELREASNQKIEASLRQQGEKYQQAMAAQANKYEKELRSLRTELVEKEAAGNAEELREELEMWRSRFEELQAKVEPFMEQLDAYEAEKHFLLGQNKDAAQEVDKLGKEYAKLLGHQNQKQKIKHVLKMKEENSALKQEVYKLRDETTKLKRKVLKLESSQEGKSRFDTSKAFQHAKENVPTTPLREGNRQRPRLQ